MRFILDYIGSIIIGSVVLLALLGFYMTLGETASSRNALAIVERNMNGATEILEADLRKAGYRVDDSVKVTRADTSQIIFRTDIGDDGAVDSVRYYLGSVQSSGSANPRTRALYRAINTQTPTIIDVGVTRFRLSYFNASGATATQVSTIRSVGILLNMQTTLSNDSVNAGASWHKVIKPLNLR